MAYTTTVLAWSTLRYYRTIIKLREEKAALDILRWAGKGSQITKTWELLKYRCNNIVIKSCALKLLFAVIC